MRLPKDRKQGVWPKWRAQLAVPFVQQVTHPCCRHDPRRPQAPCRRLDRVLAGGVLVYERQRDDWAKQEVANCLPALDGKAFAVLEDVQCATALFGVVQIDETLCPLAAKDQPLMSDGSKMPGGCSEGKMCTGIGCDNKGSSVFKGEGLGKTGGAKTAEAFGGHISPGSRLVHGKENGHNMPVGKLGPISETYDSRNICKMPDSQNPLHSVNRLCCLLKLFLSSHSGFSGDDLGGCLNLFWVIMNPPSTKMGKAAFVLDRAMYNPKSLSYREFYGKKPR